MAPCPNWSPINLTRRESVLLRLTESLHSRILEYTLRIESGHPDAANYYVERSAISVGLYSISLELSSIRNPEFEEHLAQATFLDIQAELLAVPAHLHPYMLVHVYSNLLMPFY